MTMLNIAAVYGGALYLSPSWNFISIGVARSKSSPPYKYLVTVYINNGFFPPVYFEFANTNLHIDLYSTSNYSFVFGGGLNGKISEIQVLDFISTQ